VVEVKENSYVLILYGERKFLKKVERKKSLSVQGETLFFEKIIGKRLPTKEGNLYILEPDLEEIILFGFKRETQIVYPKDAFYIAYKLNLDKSKTVFEFGTGSGALTAVLSKLAKYVVSYEKREKFYKLAKKNLERFNLLENVKLINEDFLYCKEEKESFDAGFVDVKEPQVYLEKILYVLKKGGSLGFLLPTTNQVVGLLSELESKVCNIEVLEILLRKYKTNPHRLRPEDRMVGHTAYLLFCKKL